MNNGAFGENFPYSNFHDLNMDWIIKIAKDFLDQYTHIQEIIANGEQSLQDLTTSGLEQLQEKADALEALLQQWYDTHSADIANQLADALKDLNAWYTEHKGYLDQYLTDSITTFNQTADQKGQQVIESIPDDYTEFFTQALKNSGVNGYQGAFINNADNALANSIYAIFSNETNHYPANLPRDNITKAFLITLTSYVKYNDTGDKAFWTQLLTDNYFNILYIRRRTTGFGSTSWESWEKMAYSPIANNNKLNLFTNCFSDADNLIVYNSAVTGKYCDINDGSIGTNADFNYVVVPVTPGSSYTLTGNAVGNLMIAFYSANNIGTGTFISGVVRRINTGGYKTDVVAPSTATYAAISYNKNESTVWVGLTAKYIRPSIKDDIRIPRALQPSGIIGYSGTALQDANDAEANTVYKTFNSESQYYAQHLPRNIGGYLFTFTNTTTVGNMQFWNQVLVDEGMNAYAYRKKVVGYGSEQWGEWQSIGRTIYVKKDGTGDFTKLTDALAYGAKNKNTTIYLDNGEYDFIEELGAEYFENFRYVAYSNMGPKIGNGTHLICSPSAKVVCHYTGTNNDVINGFSPLNPVCENTHEGLGDFIIEGLNIEVSNVRYAVHDDFGAQSIPVVHKYKRCHMVYNGIKQCIGSGLGKAGDLLVEDCYFNTTGGGEALLFHNTEGFSNAQSSITIKNCYIDGTGYLRINAIGQQTEITPVLVTGNSFGNAISKTVRTGDQDNMRLLDWNNVIRQ